MAFNGMTITAQGANLQTKIQAGATLTFTRIKIGDGVLAAVSSLEALTDLIDPLLVVQIESVASLGDGTYRVRGTLTNSSVATGFFVREIGVYATDPDDGEILYSIANAGSECDYLPAGGGSVVVEQVLDIVTAVGNASSVTATINEGAVLVSLASFTEHVEDKTNPHSVTAKQAGALPIAGGDMTGAINETSVTMTSAENMNIGAAIGNLILVSGTTTISAFDEVQAGTRRRLKFSEALTIEYNAASIILPGKTNLLVRAGDTAEFISLGSGLWYCSDFQPARGYVQNKTWPLKDVEIIAHRGFLSYAPENTVVAWEQAIIYGADSLECDVQISSDGTPVVIHDTTVDRTTDGTGNVSELTLAELEAMDAGSFYSTVFAGVTIPTFEDFLKCAVKGRIKRIYPEIKSYRTTADIATMVALVADYNLEGKCTFQSSTFSDFDYVRAVSEKVEIGYLVEDLTTFNIALVLAKADGNAVILAEYSFVLANPTVVATARNNGIDIAVWTVEYSYYIQQLLDIGVTRFMTNKRIGVLLEC
ncbi:MAG: glycerophosphoryl diester phosphodiesterase [Firmicutes bacterium]|nr:glycerophosphoryl diester phosphodiesterase [Bacillota bacterium]